MASLLKENEREAHHCCAKYRQAHASVMPHPYLFHVAQDKKKISKGGLKNSHIN